MAKGKAVKKAQARPGTQTGPAPQTGRVQQIGKGSSQVVLDAAALLDEEIAAGIVAAKQVQQRFQKEWRIDAGDFSQALKKFQGDAHDVVNMLNDQFARLRTQESADLVSRFTRSANNLLDLFVELVNTGAEMADQLAQSNLKKKPDAGNAQPGH